MGFLEQADVYNQAIARFVTRVREERLPQRAI